MTELDDQVANERGNSEQIHVTTGREAVEHPDDVVADVAEASGIIDTITSHEPAGDVDEIWTCDKRLPGFGDRRETCGDPFARFCPDCGETSEWGQTCYQSTCPRCAPSWARRLATSWAAQLEQARRVRQAQKDRHQRFHHVVVSPPADFNPAAEDEWERGAEIVREILEDADLEGFIPFHAYRGKDEEENDLGVWKNRVFGEKTWSEVDDEIRFSPHYHCIVVGHQVPGGDVTRAVEEATGWVIHRITKRDSNVSLYDEYDLARALSYCLSHSALYETEQSTHVCAKRAGELLKPGGGITWTPDENEEDAKLKRQYDAVMRSVAPKTLGLDYNDLACGADRENCDHDHENQDEKADLDHAEGKARYASGTTGATAPTGRAEQDAGELPDDRAGELPDASNLPDPPGGGSWSDAELDDLKTLADDDLPANVDRDDLRRLVEDDDQDDTERCNGRLLSIAKAPRYLDNGLWRADAPHAEQLADDYEEWRERLDWVG